MKKITEMYLERVFDDMKREDMNVIKYNLKRLCNIDIIETLLTNEVDNVWLNADSIFELVSKHTTSVFEKLLKVKDVKCDNIDTVVNEYCFKVGIDNFGSLIITIKCNVEGIAYTTEEYIDYLAKNGVVRYSESKRNGKYNIPFVYRKEFSRDFSLDSIREHILKSE